MFTLQISFKPLLPPYSPPPPGQKGKIRLYVYLTVNSKDENSQGFCPIYAPEFSLWIEKLIKDIAQNMIGFACNFLISYCHCLVDKRITVCHSSKRKKGSCGFFANCQKDRKTGIYFRQYGNACGTPLTFAICHQDPRGNKYFNQFTFRRLAMQRQACRLPLHTYQNIKIWCDGPFKEDQIVCIYTFI